MTATTSSGTGRSTGGPRVAPGGDAAGDGGQRPAGPPVPLPPWRRITPWGWAVTALVLLALPYLISDYDCFQLARVTTTALAVASLVLLIGHTGQISAGQGALFGLGAYTCAILVVKAGTPWPLAVLAAIAVSWVAGLLLGWPALRLGGLNLGLLTIAVAVLLPLVLTRAEGLTGGAFGLQLPPLQAPSVTGYSDAQWVAQLCTVTLLAVVWLLAGITRGRTGRALDALRERPLMARAQGVHTARLSVAVVGVSGAVAGLGGALNALVLQSATPDTYSITFSLALLTGAVVGGLRSWAGALIGAAYVVYVPELISQNIPGTTAGQWSQVAYAATLLLTLYFAPTGLAGSITRLTRLLRRTRTGATAPPPTAPSPAEMPVAAPGGAPADPSEPAPPSAAPLQRDGDPR